MLPILCRALFLGATLVLPAVYAVPVLAADAMPDSRFVGYAQQVDDFEIASGQLALAKSSSEAVRGFATRMIADHTNAAQVLAKARSEAGVSFAPDPNAAPHTAAILQRLNQLQGPEFDAAYSNAQLAVLTEAEQQYAANSADQSSSSGSASTGVMMRFAKGELPHMQAHLELAKGLAGAR
jgi:putative membrane protein